MNDVEGLGLGQEGWAIEVVGASRVIEEER